MFSLEIEIARGIYTARENIYHKYVKRDKERGNPQLEALCLQTMKILGRWKL